MTDPLAAWLDEMAAKCRAATPGRWFVAGLPWDDRSTAVYAGSPPDPHGADLITDCNVTMDWEEGDENPEVRDRANAAYIAALPPETVSALLECVHGLERVLDYCRKYCGRADRCYTGEHHAAREALARLRKLAEGRRG